MTDALPHDYFCYVISNKFPRLLAEREIIANAFFQRCLWRGLAPNPLQSYEKEDERTSVRRNNVQGLGNDVCNLFAGKTLCAA